MNIKRHSKKFNFISRHSPLIGEPERGFLILFFILFSLLGFSQTESIFWKIEHPDIKKPSYLFGTYHLINNGFLDKDAKKVAKVYNKATTIVVESLSGEEGEDEALARHIFTDTSLAKCLSPKDYRLVDSIFYLRIGDSLSAYDNFQPMIISIIIGVEYHNQYLKDNGNYEGEPIDLYIQNTGQANALEVVGLESADESFSYAIDSISLTDQLQMLVDACIHDSAMYRIAGKMYETYRANDMKGLLEITDYYNTLIEDLGVDFMTSGRNLLWLPRLEKQLQKGNVFVAVGSLHFSGEKGLINLLREKGYVLTPLEIR